MYTGAGLPKGFRYSSIVNKVAFISASVFWYGVNCGSYERFPPNSDEVKVSWRTGSSVGSYIVPVSIGATEVVSGCMVAASRMLVMRTNGADVGDGRAMCVASANRIMRSNVVRVLVLEVEVGMDGVGGKTIFETGVGDGKY